MEWLENDGMGVCGYTYDQAQRMPIDALARAINVRHKATRDVVKGLLDAVFGSSDETPQGVPLKESVRPLTEVFDVLFP